MMRMMMILALAGLAACSGDTQQEPNMDVPEHPQEDKSAGIMGLTEVVVKKVKVAPADANHASWKEAKATKLTLSAQVVVPPTGGTGTKAQVKAVHDGEWLSIRLSWADKTPDRAVGVDTFRDAAAVGFPMNDQPASPFMGDEKNPVAIWQWSANHQANNDGQSEFAKMYPRVDGVWYADHDVAMSFRVHRWRGVEPIEHFVAHGHGTLTPTPDDTLTGGGTWNNGTWTVVFQRKLSSSAPPAFAAGGATQIIVALWNGNSKEVNGRKSVTLYWTPIKLEK